MKRLPKGKYSMESSYFICSVKGVKVEKEDSYNCTFRDLEQHKLRLAVKHCCSYADVTMVYQIGEGKKHDAVL